MKELKPHHTAISVRNLDTSLAFYGALGFTEVNRSAFGEATIVHLTLGGFAIELFAFPKSADLPPLDLGFGNGLEVIGLKHIALATDDIDEALAELQRRGLADSSVTVDGLVDGRAKWFFFKDPDGLWVEIIQENRFSL
ncbi:MAG TPA: VOC family protein [Pseudolysinimonas sp.]|nr:VOC family protein [Pseudolysinimonas sp.]